MGIVDLEFVETHITNNQITSDNDKDNSMYLEPVAYRWSHGATDTHLGAGMLYYAIVYYMKAKTCVCLGSGGGFVPRIMSQARADLYYDNTFESSEGFEWVNTGTTIVVDACNGVNGEVDWEDKDSFLRQTFRPRFIKDTSENAYYDYFVKHDIKIDYLHIDADHSYDAIKQDFELYSNIMSKDGIISIHDTDVRYTKNLLITEDVKDGHSIEEDGVDGPAKFIEEISDEWQRFDFFNLDIIRSRPSSTGVTLLRRK